MNKNFSQGFDNTANNLCADNAENSDRIIYEPATISYERPSLARSSLVALAPPLTYDVTPVVLD